MKVLIIHQKKQDNHWFSVSEMELLLDSTHKMNKNDVSIITMEAYEEAINSRNRGFCNVRFKPNLVISMATDDVKSLTQNLELGIGYDVKLFVLEKRHRCHSTCPINAVKQKSCQWTDGIFYAGIRHGGKIKLGDTVCLDIPKLTLSKQTDIIG